MFNRIQFQNNQGWWGKVEANSDRGNNGNISAYSLWVFTQSLEKTFLRLGSGSSLNAVLFDAWVQCQEGNWSKSAFYLNIKTRHTSKKRGTRKWMLSTEMDKLFGVSVAEAMRQHKANDKTLWEKETRFHPELPDKEETGVVVL